MHLVYDLQACQTDSRDRGIGRYAYNLVQAVLQLSPERGVTRTTLALDGTDAADRLREVRNRIRHEGFDAATAIYSYPRRPAATRDQEPAHAEVAAQLRGLFYEEMAPDALLLLSHFETNSNYTTEIAWRESRRVPSIAIAYDLIPLIYPNHYLPEGHSISDWYRKKCEAFAKFDHFLAISQATRNDLIERLRIAPERITVIGAGLDSKLLRLAEGEASDDARWLKKLGIGEPFVLVGSNLDWRKNTLGALEAYARLSDGVKKRHLIVLTQVGEEIHAALKGSLKSIAHRVRIVGKVSDEALAVLYRRCEVFFFPSYYEGFGLPVLEAMAFGAAVLSSNAGSLREVMHRDDCLFDPDNKSEMTAKLQAALESEDRRTELRRGVQEHARGYQWKDCAEKALKAIAVTVEKAAKTRKQVTKPPRGQLNIPSSNVDTWIDFLSASADAEDLVKFENGVRAAAAQGVRRILVDVTTVSIDDARTGIQRVVRNFARGLYEASLAGAFDVRLIRWTEDGVFYANSYARESLSLPLVERDLPLRVQPNDLLFMVDSSWNNPARFDALNASVWEKGGEVVWMVYDLIPILFPHTCDPGMPPAFTQWLEHVVNKADGFICISNATRVDLEKYIDEKCRSKTRPWTNFVHLGSDLDPQAERVAVRMPSPLLSCLNNAPFLLTIGTIEPRKDHATILEAFEQAWADGSNCALVIVGKQGWNVGELAARIRTHIELNKKLFWFEGVEDQDLPYLLKNAKALIQASISEGFGLPIIEAAAYDTPLILSDIPVFREVAGSNAAYFPVGDSKALALHVNRGTVHGFKKIEEGTLRTTSWQETSEKLARLLLPGI